MAGEDLSRREQDEVTCACPYCDETMDAQAPWCKTCEVVVRFCTSCKEPLLAEVTICQSCGAECEG